jgi:hypothetical protein
MSDAPMGTQARTKHSSGTGDWEDDIDSLFNRKPSEMSQKDYTKLVARQLREKLVKSIGT